MVSKYVKRPVVVEAIQWDGKNLCEICKFVGKSPDELFRSGKLCIETLEGEHLASIGDYIIKGVAGEFYPCKPDIFEVTYYSAV